MTFSCDSIHDPEIRKKIEAAKKVTGLAAPLICLPNIHPKAGLESPPQFVAATKDTIVPHLTAPAMNCGMSLFATTLREEDFSEEFLKKFASNIRKGVSKRISKTKSLFRWLGLDLEVEPPNRYDITKKQLEDIFLRGAEAAIEIYDLPKEERSRMEYGGRIFRDDINLRGLIPRSTYTNGRHEMGYNFGGNHFLEIQYVEKILDLEKAREWNLKEKQIVMFYHGGGGHGTYHLGRYFARREKNTPTEKVILFILKFVFHLFSLNGIKNARARWHAYFSSKPFPETNINTPEGKRLWRSTQIALNYGYAFRAALLRRIKDALPSGDASFLWDAAHNSIIKENGMLIHRQDAVRVFDGKPIMIAGSNNTLSYLGYGSSGAHVSSFSCTPSAGQTIEQYEHDGKSKKEPSYVSLISKRKNPELKRVEHITSEGLFAVTDELEKHDIIKPVAYLRPLGGLKGH